MTDYEMRKIAKMQAEYMLEAIRSDADMLDLIYPPRLMNVDEASEYLRIPVSTIYQKINEIPHEKVGKRLVFTDRGLIRWIKRTGRTVTVPVEKMRKVI